MSDANTARAAVRPGATGGGGVIDRRHVQVGVAASVDGGGAAVHAASSVVYGRDANVRSGGAGTSGDDAESNANSGAIRVCDAAMNADSAAIYSGSADR